MVLDQLYKIVTKQKQCLLVDNKIEQTMSIMAYKHPRMVHMNILFPCNRISHQL